MGHSSQPSFLKEKWEKKVGEPTCGSLATRGALISLIGAGTSLVVSAPFSVEESEEEVVVAIGVVRGPPVVEGEVVEVVGGLSEGGTA